MGNRNRTTTPPVTTPVVTPPVTTTEVVTPPTTLTPEVVTQYRTELAALQARVNELKGILATQQIHVLVTSTVVAPVALVRSIYLALHAQPRGVVLAKCIKAGIAANTAKTQYQRLRKLHAQGKLEGVLTALAQPL